MRIHDAVLARHHNCEDCFKNELDEIIERLNPCENHLLGTIITVLGVNNNEQISLLLSSAIDPVRLHSLLYPMENKCEEECPSPCRRCDYDVE
jgi:hypothetical protein